MSQFAAAYLVHPDDVVTPPVGQVRIFKNILDNLYYAKKPDGTIEPIGGGGLVDVQISTITAYVSETKGNDATAIVGSLVYLFKTIQGAITAGANFVTIVDQFHAEPAPIVLNASSLVLDASLCTFCDLYKIESSPNTSGSFVLYGGLFITISNGISFPTEGNVLVNCNTFYCQNPTGPGIEVSGNTTSNIIINAVEQIFIQGSEEGILHNSVIGTNNNFKLACPDGDIVVVAGNNKKAIMLNNSGTPYIKSRTASFASSNATAAVHLLNCNNANNATWHGYIGADISSGTNAAPLLLIEDYEGRFILESNLNQIQSTPSYALSIINTAKNLDFTMKNGELLQLEVGQKVLNITNTNGGSFYRFLGISAVGNNANQAVDIDISGAQPSYLVFENSTIQNIGVGQGVFIKYYLGQNAKIQIQDTKIITEDTSDAITSDAAGQEVRILSLYRRGTMSGNITNLIAGGIDLQDADIISGL